VLTDTADISAIRDALRRHDRAHARDLLRPALLSRPDADLWALAARACDTREAALGCLERALGLDPAHAGALALKDRLLASSPPEPPQPAGPLPMPPLAMFDPPLKPARNRRKRTTWDWLLLAAFTLLGASGGAFALSAVGVTSGFVTTLNQASGGPTPFADWQGVPLADVPNLPEVLPAARSSPLGSAGRATDVLDPGYAHEYRFEAQAGDEVAIYVQFLSLAANQVSRNIALVRPDGSSAAANCTRDYILLGDNNVALVCPIDLAGEWRVRLTGRANESTGAYFVGVEPMGGG
jgi:hypothetical protein